MDTFKFKKAIFLSLIGAGVVIIIRQLNSWLQVIAFFGLAFAIPVVFKDIRNYMWPPKTGNEEKQEEAKRTRMRRVKYGFMAVLFILFLFYLDYLILT